MKNTDTRRLFQGSPHIAPKWKRAVSLILGINSFKLTRKVRFFFHNCLQGPEWSLSVRPDSPSKVEQTCAAGFFGWCLVVGLCGRRLERAFPFPSGTPCGAPRANERGGGG